MSKEFLLSGLSLNTQAGIEIGPLHRPVVPPSTPRIFYVDHLDTDALKEKYRNDPNVKLEDLVEIGGVWGDNTLLQAAARVAPVDFVLASHVVEHVPDLVSWLAEIEEVLNAEGTLRLTVPDRRFSFDILRSESTVADVISSYLVRARKPEARHIVDHFYNATVVACTAAWDGTLDIPSLPRSHTPDWTLDVAMQAAKNDQYVDVHCWVFTPSSFAGLMKDLSAFGLLGFRCVRFLDTPQDSLEFFVILQRCTDRDTITRSWEEMAHALSASASPRAEANARKPFDALARENEALKKTVAALYDSTSWRVTAPLRWLSRRLQSR